MSPASPRRGRALALVLAVVALAVLAALWIAIDTAPTLPLSLTIDGETVFEGLDLHPRSTGEKLITLGMLTVALLTVLLVVPLALLIALAGVLLGLLLVVGLPLAAVLAVAALLLSPLLLLGWLLWRALRHSPTMPA